MVSGSATPGTAAYQVPPSMGFSRQEYWSGLPFPAPGDLPNPGIEPRSPALQTDTLPSESPRKPSSEQSVCEEGMELPVSRNSPPPAGSPTAQVSSHTVHLERASRAQASRLFPIQFQRPRSKDHCASDLPGINQRSPRYPPLGQFIC